MTQDQEVKLLGVLQEVANLKVGQNLRPYAESIVNITKPRFSITDFIYAIAAVCVYSYLLIYVVIGVFGACGNA